jgi:hypothetical protein
VRPSGPTIRCPSNAKPHVGPRVRPLQRHPRDGGAGACGGVAGRREGLGGLFGGQPRLSGCQSGLSGAPARWRDGPARRTGRKVTAIGSQGRAGGTDNRDCPTGWRAGASDGCDCPGGWSGWSDGWAGGMGRRVPGMRRAGALVRRTIATVRPDGTVIPVHSRGRRFEADGGGRAARPRLSLARSYPRGWGSPRGPWCGWQGAVATCRGGLATAARAVVA